MMTVVGINRTVTANGEIHTTLHVTEDFDSYYTNPEAGRSCEGKKVVSIYVGAYDCSKIKPHMNIDISYERAITTAKGTYSPIKRIDIISNS